MKTIIIPLKNKKAEPEKSAKFYPEYVSTSRGMCRSTGGMPHDVSFTIDTRGRLYFYDVVTERKVTFQKSITQIERDKSNKLIRRLNRLYVKALKVGLTAKEFEMLFALKNEPCINSKYEYLHRLEMIINGDRSDMGKILTRRYAQ